MHAIPQTQRSRYPCCSTTSLSTREPDPDPDLFQMGKNKGYYELNGEKATDHLYDIKDENALGNGLVEKKAENLMGNILHNIERPRKGEKCTHV
jgi:hypothetical protein